MSRRGAAGLCSALATTFVLPSCGTFGEGTPDVADAASPVEAGGDAGPEAANAPTDGGGADSVADVDAGPCRGAADCARYVFVTSETFTGEDLGGAIAADQKCSLRAATSGTATIRARKYKAWISSAGFAASKRLTHGTRPYVLPDGTLLANDWAQLTTGALFHPIDRDEANAPVGAGFVWTGSDIFGNATEKTCTDWTINGAANVGTVGRSEAVDSTWTNSGAMNCGTGLRLYCIEE